jgi:tetratricopeptide (TPR) repeat protein
MKTYITLFFSGLSVLATAQTATPDAQTLMNMGRFGEATAQLTQQARQNPTMQSHFEAGYGYLRAGQPDSARSWFEKGTALDEKRVPLNQLGVALTYLALADAANAQPRLEAVEQRSKGKNADILFRIGEAYTGYLTPDSGSIKPRYPRLVDAAKALDYLNRAAQRDAKNAAIQLALGDAHYLNRDAGTAVSRYETAIQLGMMPSRVYQRIGDIYWQGRQLNLAVENYKKAIEANASYAPAYRQLAELYYLVNRYKDAANYTEQYMKVANDTRPDMYLRLAQFHFLGKDYQKAVDVITAHRAVLASNPIIYRIEGWSQSALKQPQKAIESIETFLAKAPQKVIYDDYKYLGQAYLGLEGAGSDSLKAKTDSIGVAYLWRAAPSDTTDNLFSDIAKYYYRAKKHPEAVAALDSAAKYGFRADNQDLFRYGMSNYTLGFGRDSLGKFMRDTLRFTKADSALALSQKASPDYAPTVLYRAKANYYAYPPEAAVRNGKAKPYFEQFIGMVETKEDDRKRYQKDLALAFKYLISYHELVSKDDAARREWLRKGQDWLPNNADLAKIAASDTDTAQAE